jgi:hypothetical protein
MSALAGPPASIVQGNFVWLRADSLSLLLPQKEVGEAEHLGCGLEPGEVPGLLRSRSGAAGRHYAALSCDMKLLPHCPSDRFVVAALGAGTGTIAWCWNEMRVLIGVQLRLQPLPAVLLMPTTPVTSYVELAGSFAFVCDAQGLHAFAVGFPTP